MDRFVGALEEASGQSILTGNRMRRKGMLKVIDGIVAAACLGRNATRVGFEIVSKLGLRAGRRRGTLDARFCLRMRQRRLG